MPGDGGYLTPGEGGVPTWQADPRSEVVHRALFDVVVEERDAYMAEANALEVRLNEAIEALRFHSIQWHPSHNDEATQEQRRANCSLCTALASITDPEGSWLERAAAKHGVQMVEDPRALDRESPPRGYDAITDPEGGDT